MSYVQSILLPNERVVYVASLHWMMYIRGLVLTIGGGLVGALSHPLLTFLIGSDLADLYARPLAFLALIAVLIGIGLLVLYYVRQTSTEIVVTSSRLITKYGFISRASYELMINRITGATLQQSALERVLGYGTLVVHGAGGDTTPIYGVANPQEFYRALTGVMDKR
ncbi:MAG: PH domain-containing protein [Alphaproteobacteria bacterium]|nr:PH domain-containing protein [Alphaproteobacteria bacterium]MBV8548588.1 PH domain-containing protein [Alphaproteobacteria bacterium]